MQASTQREIDGIVFCVICGLTFDDVVVFDDGYYDFTNTILEMIKMLRLKILPK